MDWHVGARSRELAACETAITDLVTPHIVLIVLNVLLLCCDIAKYNGNTPAVWQLNASATEMRARRLGHGAARRRHCGGRPHLGPWTRSMRQGAAELLSPILQLRDGRTAILPDS